MLEAERIKFYCRKSKHRGGRLSEGDKIISLESFNNRENWTEGSSAMLKGSLARTSRTAWFPAKKTKSFSLRQGKPKNFVDGKQRES